MTEQGRILQGLANKTEAARISGLIDSYFEGVNTAIQVGFCIGSDKISNFGLGNFNTGDLRIPDDVMCAFRQELNESLRSLQRRLRFYALSPIDLSERPEGKIK